MAWQQRVKRLDQGNMVDIPGFNCKICPPVTNMYKCASAAQLVETKYMSIIKILK